MTEKPTAFEFTEYRVPKKGEWFATSESAIPVRMRDIEDARKIGIDDRRILRPVKALADDEVAVKVEDLKLFGRVLNGVATTPDGSSARAIVYRLLPKPTLMEELIVALSPPKSLWPKDLEPVLDILVRRGIDLEARA